MELVAASFLMLFVELALIRWTGSNIVYLSYFSNFVLLGSFLGIGLGHATEGQATLDGRRAEALGHAAVEIDVVVHRVDLSVDLREHHLPAVVLAHGHSAFRDVGDRRDVRARDRDVHTRPNRPLPDAVTPVVDHGGALLRVLGAVLLARMLHFLDGATIELSLRLGAVAPNMPDKALARMSRPSDSLMSLVLATPPLAMCGFHWASTMNWDSG